MNQLTDADMEEILRPMDVATEHLRGPHNGFGQGHSMHGAAREAAPDWLRQWDDEKRWMICFTNGWRGLVVMASAFGWSKERLLADLERCRSHAIGGWMVARGRQRLRHDGTWHHITMDHTGTEAKGGTFFISREAAEKIIPVAWWMEKAAEWSRFAESSSLPDHTRRECARMAEAMKIKGN